MLQDTAAQVQGHPPTAHQRRVEVLVRRPTAGHCLVTGTKVREIQVQPRASRFLYRAQQAAEQRGAIRAAGVEEVEQLVPQGTFRPRTMGPVLRPQPLRIDDRLLGIEIAPGLLVGPLEGEHPSGIVVHDLGEAAGVVDALRLAFRVDAQDLQRRDARIAHGTAYAVHETEITPVLRFSDVPGPGGHPLDWAEHRLLQPELPLFRTILPAGRLRRRRPWKRGLWKGGRRLRPHRGADHEQQERGDLHGRESGTHAPTPFTK
jgi:hypothetical protein